MRNLCGAKKISGCKITINLSRARRYENNGLWSRNREDKGVIVGIGEKKGHKIKGL